MEASKIKIDNGFVFINGERINKVKEIEFKLGNYEENRGLAEVTIKLDANVELEGQAMIRQ